MNDSLPLIQIPTRQALPTGAARQRSAALRGVLIVACLAGTLRRRPAAAATSPAASAAAPRAPPAPPASPVPPVSPAKPVPPASPAPPTPPAGSATELPGANGRQGVRPPPAASAEVLPTIGLDEVRVGQRGYGLSVFAGGEPERFDVEVIGVMRNISPDMSYILARLSGRGLESSGVAAGMSGSPVFLDGRLAGAVSFGWPFSKEAICGITPSALMRTLATLGGPLPTTPPPPVELAAPLSGMITADLVFDKLSRGVLRQSFGSVAPTGRAASAVRVTAGVAGGRPPAMVPGSAVASVL